MSMRYYAVNDYGLVLNEEDCKLIASKSLEDFEELIKEEAEEDIDWGFLLYERDICSCIADFTGEAFCIEDDGSGWNNVYEECYGDESIFYISFDRYPKLFGKAYNSVEEIVEEMKRKVGEYLPEDFDYRKRICCIVGTTFG